MIRYVKDKNNLFNYNIWSGGEYSHNASDIAPLYLAKAIATNLQSNIGNFSFKLEPIGSIGYASISYEIDGDITNQNVTISLDHLYGSAFGTQTDKDGIGRCGTSTIQDYHVTVEINDETFEDDIIIDNEE